MADLSLVFRLFTEIETSSQLVSAMLEKKLPDGLLATHFGVVNHLARGREGAAPQDIARALQVPKTTMSHMLSVLSGRDLVELRTHPRDRRMKTVWLTEDGRAFRDVMVEAIATDLERVEAAFGERWIAETASRMEALRIWLESDRGG